MLSGIQKLKGGNMDIDLIPSSLVAWEQDRCPWNEQEKIDTHKCAVKNVSMCKFFEGIEGLDTILCSYPNGLKDESR